MKNNDAMERNRLRIWLILSFFIMFLVFTGEKLAQYVGPGRHGMDKTAMREMLGTFTDPHGKPGNSINFELEPNPINTNSALGVVQSLKGAGHLHELFGYKDMDFIWGYCEWDPKLIISIVPTPLEDTKSAEPKQRMGQFLITAVGHTVIQIKPVSAHQRNPRLVDIFKDGEPLVSVTRTLEPKYPPPKF